MTATPMKRLMIEYVDPTTGQGIFKTITFFMQMLRPGEKTLPLKQSASLIVSPFEGSGYTMVGNKKIEWYPFDTLAVPGGEWCRACEHLGQGPAILFVASDEPTLKALALLSEARQEQDRRYRTARLRSGSPEHHGKSEEHQAARQFRLPGRRPGLGRGQLSLCRPYAAADRHHHRRRLRSAQSEAVAKVEVPQGWHSHKVRVANGIMIVNHEKQGPAGDLGFGGGFGIYDVSKPADAEAASPIGAPMARACTVSISTAATPISRRPPRAMSATSR